MIEKIYVLPFLRGGIIGIIFAGTVLLCAFLFDYLEAEEMPEMQAGRHKGYGLDLWVLRAEGRVRYHEREVIYVPDRQTNTV